MTSVAHRAPTATAARLAARVELAHRRIQRIRLIGSKHAALPRRGEQPGAERLGQHEAIADRCAFALLRIRFGMHTSGDGETELELFVDDAVAADDERAGLVHLVLTAAQNLGEHLESAACPPEIRRCSAP